MPKQLSGGYTLVPIRKHGVAVDRPLQSGIDVPSNIDNTSVDVLDDGDSRSISSRTTNGENPYVHDRREFEIMLFSFFVGIVFSWVAFADKAEWLWSWVVMYASGVMHTFLFLRFGIGVRAAIKIFWLKLKRIF